MESDQDLFNLDKEYDELMGTSGGAMDTSENPFGVFSIQEPRVPLRPDPTVVFEVLPRAAPVADPPAVEVQPPRVEPEVLQLPDLGILRLRDDCGNVPP